MRILVLGASGPTGRLLVGQALGHGHEVTAFVRNPAQLLVEHERLRLLAEDAMEPASLSDAVEGQDAVISTLGARAGESARICTDGTANLVRAMVAQGVDRLVVVSAAGIGGHKRELPLAYQVVLLWPRLRADYRAIQIMEDDVMLTDLDWTIVRASVLTNRPQTGHYRVVDGPVVEGGMFISRGDLAALLLKCVETGRYVRRVVAVAY